MSLPGKNGPDLKYRDTLVKVCGLATNQFENVQISEHRDGDWRGTIPGLGVKWLDREPYTEGPEQRCVTGLLEPTCGWGDMNPDATDYKAPICISTSTVYQWSIRQTELGRN